MQDDRFYFTCTCAAVTEVFSAELHLSWQIYDGRGNYTEIVHNSPQRIIERFARFHAPKICNNKSLSVTANGVKNKKEKKKKREKKETQQSIIFNLQKYARRKRCELLFLPNHFHNFFLSWSRTLNPEILYTVINCNTLMRV